MCDIEWLKNLDLAVFVWYLCIRNKGFTVQQH